MGVETKSDIVKRHDAALDLVGALWGGTAAMREAGTRYLPKSGLEDDEDYARRKETSVLTNFFKKTIKAMSGRVCEQEIVVEGDDFAIEFAENVDMEGRNIHRFTYPLSKFTLRDGLRFILVDAPRSEGVRSLAEERAANIRPYWVEVDRRNVLGWKVDDNGSFTMVRILETYTDDSDEYVTTEKEQIRVIEPGLITIHRKDDKGNWAFYEDYTTSIDFVPFVPVYASQDEFMDSEPPLMDLAYLNVEHWQKSSDHSNIMHFACVPFLHWAGYQEQISEGKPVNVQLSANSITKDSNENAKISWITHDGKIIEVADKHLSDILDRAAKIGADFMTKKPGTITATERALDESGGNSELSAFALNLKDSLELAMMYTMRMIGREFAGSVIINTDYGILDTGLTVKDLNDAYSLGLIDAIEYWALFNQTFGTDVDVDKLVARLKEAAPMGSKVDIKE